MNKHLKQDAPSQRAIRTLMIVAVLAGTAILTAHFILARSYKDLISQNSSVKTTIAIASPERAAPRVTRQSFLEPNRKFYQNTILVDGKIIAEFKNTGDTVFDLSGSIPDGKVEFRNMSAKSNGYEYFKNGTREGEYREYHSDGRIWFEKKYERGRVTAVTEYFDNGSVRMKADYSDTLQTCETPDNGSGIVYRSNGKPMYEWHLTGMDDRRFKKFYDTDGRHLTTEYFDVKGRLINSEDNRPAATEM